MDDTSHDGRFLPAIVQEEYRVAILKSHGVAGGDLPYVVPNWEMPLGEGRGPIALYGR